MMLAVTNRRVQSAQLTKTDSEPCRGYYFADTGNWAPGTNYETIDGYGISGQSSGHVYFIGRSKIKQQTTATTPTGITLVKLNIC